VNALRVSLACQTCARCCSVSLCVSERVSVATFYIKRVPAVVLCLCVCLSVLVWPPFIEKASVKANACCDVSSKVVDFTLAFKSLQFSSNPLSALLAGIFPYPTVRPRRTVIYPAPGRVPSFTPRRGWGSPCCTAHDEGTLQQAP
jgi:hypothetical protein